MKELLYMSGISKAFSGVQALQNVSFELHEGEIHSLIGPNGSGKSTLMNILSGGLRADAGEIRIQGKVLSFKSPLQAIEQGISMIHQELKQYQYLSVAENICFGRYPMRGGLIDWEKMNQMARDALAPFRCAIDVEERISNLPLAQRQIIEIARALSNQSKVVIMDEPTASLTGEETELLFENVRRIKDQGVSIIFISHRLNEVLEISDRITVLRDGELIATLENGPNVQKDDLVVMMVPTAKVTSMRNEMPSFRQEEVVLSLRNVSVKGLLHEVSLDLYKGEVLGFAGLVGAGRTELLKTIFGTYRMEKGEILAHGQEAKNNTPKKAVKRGIAYMSEDRKKEGLVLSMSIQDNMILPSFDKMKKGPLLQFKRIGNAINKQVGALAIKCTGGEQLAKNLSGGNQQKVIIGKWLIADSDIILMDEPTRGIDVGAKEEIYKIVHELAKNGKAVIFVSSELEEVQRVSDRILVMHEGQITAELDRNASLEEMTRYAT